MVTQTYYDPKLYKTNAPPEVIYDIVKAYKKQLCEKEGTEYMLNIHEESPMRKILAKPIEHQPNFSVEQVAVANNNKKLLRKYFTPSEANWGPKARATGSKH